MTFDQVPFLVERICGICSASHPLAYIQAVEDIAQVKVPERALYLRTLVNELERIHSHVLWVGLAGHFLGTTPSGCGPGSTASRSSTCSR